MKSLLVIFIFLILSGCATVDRTAQRAELARTAPTCLTDRECELKWSAARSWVLANSGWKIQHLTNDFIETYNPVGSSTNIAVRVVKEPISKGGYKLIITTWCSNMFGCIPDAWDAAQAFNTTVNAITPPLLIKDNN